MYQQPKEIDHPGPTHSDGMSSRSWSPNMFTQLKKPAVLLICVIMLASFTPRRGRAQTTSGGISGTVKDSTGAVVRGAQITLTNEETQVTEKTVSTSSGEYIFSSVPLGTYTLRASARGFRTYVDKGIQVHIQNTVTADVPLVPGSVQEVVTVTSSVPLLQAQDASLGQTVTTEEINDLPLNGRSWLSLAGIAAGSYALGAPGSGSSTAVFVNSAEPGQVDFRLNGTDNNNNVFGGANAAPVPDAMQEFKIQSGNNSAKFGQFAGAVINAELKSGTNVYRGDVWAYLRNEALQANNYFNNLNGVRRPPYRQNQWGGTIGGPVYIPKVFNGRDKTFFFFDFQHNGILQYSQFTETVPTALMHSSGFTNLQDLINGNIPTTGATDLETDALGRTFRHGTVLDPATTRGIAKGATDPISGLKNNTAATVYVRDPFYSGGSVGGITNFTNLTSQLNVIPASRLDPNAVALLSNYPLPTASGLINDFFTIARNTQHTNQYDVRIDENISQKDLVWGAYSHSHLISQSVQPFDGPIGENLGSQGNNAPIYQTSIHYNHIFTVSIANEMTIGYNHLTSNQAGPSSNTLNIPEQYGIQGIPQFAGNGGLPAFIISGMASIGGHGSRPSLNRDTGLQYQDNLMIVRSNQVFNIGFNFDHIRGNITQPPASRGQFS
jgi:Carboxypeptidase regulatory-like domain